MNKKKYPCGEDIRHFLTDFCFEVSADVQFDHLAKEASQDWEIKTGWSPFLATSKIFTRSFKIEKHLTYSSHFRVGMVDLKGGLLHIDKISNESGTILELGKDYNLCPKYSDLLDSYQWIEIHGHALMSRQVDIIGAWGACNKIPLIVWSAILKKAAAEALACFSCTKDARLEKWSEGSVTEQYKIHPFKDIIERWEKNFSNVVGLYKRVPALL